MNGRVTVAQNVRGEQVGEVVQRTWTFTPLCATGPCARATRPGRATGTDTLTLQQTAPDTYAGSGTFFAPLRCAGRVYPHGQEVPFRITVAHHRDHRRRGEHDQRHVRQPLADQPDSVRRRPRARRRALHRSARPRLNPQRPQHVAEHGELPRALGARAGQHHVQAERPAGGGEEVLRARLSGPGMGQPADAEARSDRAWSAFGATANRPRPGSRPAPGRYSVRARNEAPAGIARRAPVAELAVVERKLEVAGVEGGAAGRALEHAAAPAARQRRPAARAPRARSRQHECEGEHPGLGGHRRPIGPGARHRARARWNSSSWRWLRTPAAASGVRPRTAPKQPRTIAPAEAFAVRNAASSAT